MKRSQINELLKESLTFFELYRFALPPWAKWGVETWKEKKEYAQEIIENHLGWDITDFGSGEFFKKGLILFTLRNGNIKEAIGKSYAEKIMIVREEQTTPAHFHWYKMEDIINRGGGVLVVQLWNSTEGKKLADTPVKVHIDGISHTIPAGGTIELRVGESVCLPPKLYHQFWGKKGQGKVLVGEVSKVNDDFTDNYFYEPIGRFPTTEEDEPPLYLLCNDYEQFV
ncbi:MAG: D-lyxose/D-mannose family sugar isomerase [Thermoflexibacter sp.]